MPCGALRPAMTDGPASCSLEPRLPGSEGTPCPAPGGQQWVVGGPSSWRAPAEQMGLSELFEGGSLMYINWQTAHPVAAAWKEPCSCELAKGTAERSWQAGWHCVGGGKGCAVGWVGRIQR